MTIPPPLILLVEDELPVQRFIHAALTAAGYRIVVANTLHSARAHSGGHRPDLILLDLGLPDGDGLELLTTLRPDNRTPIVILSARGDERAKVFALDAGADDYLTKPFSVPELLARIRVALRHAVAPAELVGASAYHADGLFVDPVRRTVSHDGQPVHLTPTEYRLLLVLIRHAGMVVTHRRLLQEVWGENAIDQPHYLRVYMGQLRHKLERDPTQPTLLLTESGVGYRLREPDS